MLGFPHERAHDPVEIVEEYLRLHMIPDPDSARQFCAPGMEIRFTGNRLMHDPAEATAFNKSRYKWVKKKFGPTHVVAGGTRGGDHRLPDRHTSTANGSTARPSRATATSTATSCAAARSCRWKSGTTAPSGFWCVPGWPSPNLVQRRSRHTGATPTRRSPGAPDYSWPGKKRLAVYIGFNVEHFEFGAGLGAALGPKSPEPDVLNYSWRDYGNRVGVWRCLELFDSLKLPVGALINTALYDYCPEVVEALRQARRRAHRPRPHELGAAGRAAAKQRNGSCSQYCSDRIRKESKTRAAGLAQPVDLGERASRPTCWPETGYRYTLNWCHDDQPVEFKTRSGSAVVDPVPAGAERHPDDRRAADGRPRLRRHDRRQLRRDAARSRRTQPLVMGIALHPYLVGQPYRLRHLRRALKHIAKQKKAWLTTPGKIYDFVARTPTALKKV